MKIIIFLFLLYFSVETNTFDFYVYKNMGIIEKQNQQIEKLAIRYRQEYSLIKYIFDISSNYDIDPLLFLSLIKTESDFIADAKSKTGAYGYCQITKIVAQDLNVNLSRKNQKENILLGAMFLNKLKERYGDLELALIHYNAGTKEEYKQNGIRYAKRIFREYKILKELLK